VKSVTQIRLQNGFMALQIAHRAYVLETEMIALSGPAAELQADPKVPAAYLGELVLDHSLEDN